MTGLYPILLLPEFVERVWGARDLSLLYPHKSARQGGEYPNPVGEVWLTGDECRVANGDLAGQTLAELTKRHGRALVGSAAPEAERFPLLVKFLFPKEKLSVQVHPDDAMAQATGEGHGKSECWYVLAAEPGAQVALGLRPGVTREQAAQAIESQSLEQLLLWEVIHPGELIYVPAGTVHAIGPGSILVEVQQNSDTTYRLYDYGRGRELHVRQGLQAMKETTGAGKVQCRPVEGGVRLVEAPHFTVEKYVVKEPRNFFCGPKESSAQVLVALDGCGIIECAGMAPVTLARGETAVLPATVREFRLRPQWALECLRAFVPDGPR